LAGHVDQKKEVRNAKFWKARGWDSGGEIFKQNFKRLRGCELG
jgi:hypothetical protein